ncbi:hypothetical protein WICMUC_004267 [Wickerhamomyces mucosus]|uniref:Cysteine protease n=1 Tax=Wickerhamomyces mucosus TaxID=1378264 RepID=A0A9P8PI45_9ASCO|nr:hypothetical protein WICMUC_004267 [Wickerhamomyces mucosus]
MSSHGFQRIVELFWDKDLENNDSVNPIVVLGKIYDSHTNQDKNTGENDPISNRGISSVSDNSLQDLKQIFKKFTNSNSQSIPIDLEWPENFLDDVYTRLWFTYRTKFPPIPRDKDGPSPLTIQNLIRGQNIDLNNENFTTDCGWGCMIRTAQTLLANALLNLEFGRDFKFDLNIRNEEHDKIVTWFADEPSQPFSIHKIVDQGKILSGKKAGEWFGPSAAARSIQSLCNEFKSCGLNVYIGGDSGDIYERDFLAKAMGIKDDEFVPTLILLGVRLGVENVNSLYWQSLRDILSLEESVGISGGRPSSSHYFLGYQGDFLFYLDPHLPQPALKSEELEQSISDSTEIISNLDIKSVHTKKLRKIHLNDVDPSMLLGFLIKDEQQWYNFKSEIGDAENKIVHISSDQSLPDLSNRVPSFTVYENNNDSFVDIGLEYDEIQKKNENPKSIDSDGQETLNILHKENKNQDEEKLDVLEIESQSQNVIIGSKNQVEDNDDSVVVLNEDSSDIIIDDSIGVVSSETFDEISNSIKDDYENISTGVKADESLREEPYLIGSAEMEISETWENEIKDNYEYYE